MAAEKKSIASAGVTSKGQIIAVRAGNARQTFVAPPHAGAGTAAQYAAPVAAVIAPNARQTRV